MVRDQAGPAGDRRILNEPWCRKSLVRVILADYDVENNYCFII
jgi:hypothetical protein